MHVPNFKNMNNLTKWSGILYISKMIPHQNEIYTLYCLYVKIIWEKLFHKNMKYKDFSIGLVLLALTLSLD